MEKEINSNQQPWLGALLPPDVCELPAQNGDGLSIPELTPEQRYPLIPTVGFWCRRYLPARNSKRCAISVIVSTTTQNLSQSMNGALSAVLTRN